ncbi:hypothetical protein [Inquilinus limosus]|uniref:Uncharacterized protein n=1 Tax=Inquilinus limosus TaxID=171674 RepID=A0A211ZIA7_9PROT|nr:hypothetical protein [Inquilinus limosus]OWJ65018.1 hypothetical protein BWR60_21875 [Inquilinus limosus]
MTDAKGGSGATGADAGPEALGGAEGLLARLVRSGAEVDSAQADYGGLRRFLPGLLARAAGTTERQKEVAAETQEDLAATRQVIDAITATARRLTRSLAEENDALVALFSDPGALETISRSGSGVLSQLQAAAPATTPAAVPAVAPAGTTPAALSPKAQFLLPQITEALRRVIEREVERRVDERLAPLRAQLAGIINSATAAPPPPAEPRGRLMR